MSNVIKCTPDLQKLALTAVQIQDASNLTPVVGFLHKVCIDLRATGLDSNGVRNHPITLAVLNKINSMCIKSDEHMYCEFYCHANCEYLAEGHDAQWPDSYVAPNEEKVQTDIVSSE